MNWENIVLEVTHDHSTDGGKSRRRWVARLRDGLYDYEAVPLSIGYPEADPGGGFPVAILDFLGNIGFEPYHIETHNFMGETSLGEVAEPYARIWLFEVNRGLSSVRLLFVAWAEAVMLFFSWFRGCKRCGRGVFGWRGCGSRRRGGLRAWRCG